LGNKRKHELQFHSVEISNKTRICVIERRHQMLILRHQARAINDAGREL